MNHLIAILVLLTPPALLAFVYFRGLKVSARHLVSLVIAFAGCTVFALMFNEVAATDRSTGMLGGIINAIFTGYYSLILNGFVFAAFVMLYFRDKRNNHELP